MGDELKDLYNTNVTIISNEFLEKYLADINPEFLRVYLFFRWRGNENLNTEEIANELNLTTNDVERAVKYWVKQKNLNKQEKKIFKEVNSKELSDNNENKIKIIDITKEVVKNSKPVFKTDEKEYKELLLYAGGMLPNISSVQCNLFKELYYDEGMPLEVIKYLIDYCVEQGKVNNRYMSSVAVSWLENGFKTVDEVKKSEESYKLSKMKTKKVVRRKAPVIANKTDVDYEKMFLEKSRKRGNG